MHISFSITIRLLMWINLFYFSVNVYAQSYYIDNESGNDFNTGKTPGAAWKSLRKVSFFSFKPGDVIALKRSLIWNETLIVRSSGTELKPIKYISYGTGKNPIIKTSDTYNNWQLDVNHKGLKIWKGRIKGHKNHWSAIQDKVRVPVYFGYKTEGHQKKYSAPIRLADMKEGYFYSPLNKDVFYFRSDDGNPGIFEIGMRRYAIYVKDKSFIIFDGIDTYGPGGQANSGSATGSAHVVVQSSDHITIKNSKHSHNHNNGIRVTDGSSDCVIENVVSNGHRSTGIYFWEAGSNNKIIKSEVYECGTVISDTGDMGLIGVWQTSNTIIKQCFVHDNGHENIEGMDAAISIVRSKNTTIIQNLVQNVGGTGIMVASDSDDSNVAYNIVNGWGVMGGNFKANRGCAGIKVGSGPAVSTVKNISIYNNLISHGAKCGKYRGALRVTRNDTFGLKVKNNIINENGSNFDILADDYLLYPAWSFDKNILFNSLGSRIRLNKKVFNNDAVKSALSFFSDMEDNTIMISPQLDLSNNRLLPSSIAIDNGVSNSYKEDFNGIKLPQGMGFDIGPFEYNHNSAN